MSDKEDGSRERIPASWGEKWRIPRSDLGSVLFVFAVFALFFVWLGISVFGVEAEAIKAAHKFLPQWFFFANLFICPTLLAFAAAPLPVPRFLRLALTALMFCSGSLFLVTRQHQAAGLVMLGLLYVEAFWIIPRWNRWSDRRKGIVRPAPVHHSLKTRLRDLLIYVAIAVAFTAAVVIYALGHR